MAVSRNWSRGVQWRELLDRIIGKPGTFSANRTGRLVNPTVFVLDLVDEALKAIWATFGLETGPIGDGDATNSRGGDLSGLGSEFEPIDEDLPQVGSEMEPIDEDLPNFGPGMEPIG